MDKQFSVLHTLSLPEHPSPVTHATEIIRVFGFLLTAAASMTMSAATADDDDAAPLFLSPGIHSSRHVADGEKEDGDCSDADEFAVHDGSC